MNTRPSFPHSPATPDGFPTSRGGNPILGTFTARHMAEAELATLQRAYAFLQHEGHPTSASHLAPLVRAAQCAVMQGDA